MTAATNSNGTGAATAAPDLQHYVDLEGLISAADDEAIHARWLFGKELLKERGPGGELPKGRLTEVAKAIGRGRTEVGIRMRFAERFPTDEERRDAIATFGSWYKITHEGFAATSTRPKTEKPKAKQRKNSEGGKANHRLKSERRQAGRPTDELYYMRERVNRAASELEWFDLEGFAWDEWTQELVLDAYEDLARLEKWVTHALDVTQVHMGGLARQRRLWLLRERSYDPSSTENERRTAARQAERLAGRLGIS
jgi:hypothetical protein